MEPINRSWTVLVRLLRPQGRKGELLADLLTDFPDSLAGRKNLYLLPQNSEDLESKGRPIEILSSWLPVGRNSGRVVLQIEGVSSITEAEQLSGLDIVVPDEERLTLDEETSYVSDLTGCSVFDGTTLVGEITDVQFHTTPHGGRVDDLPTLLEVTSPDGAEILIPFVKAFVVSLNIPEKKIVLNLPLGLIDVNR